jgi:hypothetical protein
MNNYTAIGLATLLVIVNGLFDHFSPPSGIELTPFVLITTSLIIGFGAKNIHVVLISILTFSFVSLNDILIKLYGGGTHDKEGQDWVFLFMFIGLVPTFFILAIAVLRKKDEKIFNKIVSIVLFIALVVIHSQLFSTLGLGRHYG